MLHQNKNNSKSFVFKRDKIFLIFLAISMIVFEGIILNIITIEDKNIHDYFEIVIISTATIILVFAIYHHKQKEVSVKELNDIKKVLNEASIIAVTDATGKIIFVNDKFCEISKYSKEELLGKDHRILKSGYHSRDFYENLWDTIMSGKTWRGEIKNKAKDGTYYWVKTIIIPKKDQNNKILGFTTVRTDITEQKNQQELVARIDEKKDEFIAMISHELKTPLSPIMSWAGMLHEGILGELTEKQKHGIEKIQDNSKELLKLIHDMLDVHKLELGKMTFTISCFNIKELLYQIIEDYNVNEREKCLFLLESEDIMINSDSSRITQVIKNFVNNALDFLPEDNPKIIISTRNEGNYIIISVKDNGPGISENNQADLFKKFYQVDTSATREHEGSGLGLAICRGIAERLNGEIGVRSEIGNGSEFFIKIPKKSTIQLTN